MLFYHIQDPLATLDCVQFINNFFKLFSLNLNTIAIHNQPISIFIFICQTTELIFANTEILRRFFNGQGITLPDRNICLLHKILLSQSHVRFHKSSFTSNRTALAKLTGVPPLHGSRPTVLIACDAFNARTMTIQEYHYYDKNVFAGNPAKDYFSDH